MWTKSWWHRFIISVIAFTLPQGIAFAGGLDRFDQGIDLLFDAANTALSATGTYVVTATEYNSVNGRAESVPLLADFSQFSLNLKVTPSQSTACLLAARQPFGTDGDHGSNWSEATVIVAQKLRVNELSLTCSYRSQLGLGFVRGIAGVSRDLARFDQSAIDASAPAGPITSNIGFDGEAWSWRAGLAYEIPSAAMVASIVYYAPLPFDIHGRIDQLPLGDHAFLASVPIAGETTFPQAIEGSLQGLIAPGWIMGASVKWMDWSVLDHVPLRTSTDVGLLPANTTAVDFKTFFRDGWTFGLFAGHQIDNDWSIGVKVLWDRGVATGWTEHTASWSAFGAVQYRLNQSIDISGGLAYVGLSGGAIDKRKEGAPFDAIFGDGYALVPRLGITARF